jgi:hypothetical protein
MLASGNLTRSILTQAAQQSQGIQTLLEAEKEAAKIVQEARQCALSPYLFFSFYILILVQTECKSLKMLAHRLERRSKNIKSQRSRSSRLSRHQYVSLLDLRPHLCSQLYLLLACWRLSKPSGLGRQGHRGQAHNRLGVL